MGPADYAEVVARALDEDLNARGDITSNACVGSGAESEAIVVARNPGVIAGLEVGAYVFEAVDSSLRFEPEVTDGDTLTAGQSLATVRGRSRSILAAERTALNLMGRMSGVATATRRFVDLVAGTRAKITDTRKTMPGMRALDKYAVRMGGGVNHRFGLYDAVLIKDNHLVASGGISTAVAAARRAVDPGIIVEVEVETLDQLRQALETGVDRALLDNMSNEMMRQAVELVDGRVTVEASGGITELNVRSVAKTGVDYISLGWITHSAPQLDIALDFTA